MDDQSVDRKPPEGENRIGHRSPDKNPLPQSPKISSEAPKISKLVHTTPITMVYGTYNYSYWGS